MLYLLIFNIFTFAHPIKDLLIGNWSVQSREIVFDDNLDMNHTYHLQFLEYEQVSVIGDLIEHLNNSKTDFITTLKLDFSDLITIVSTGNLKYFYKLIRIEFIRSRSQMFFAQGKFIDGTGDYMISIYSSSRIDATIYEKGKISYFSMEKEIPFVLFAWMSKYFYFLPVTILLIIFTLLPCENKQTKEINKVKID